MKRTVAISTIALLSYSTSAFAGFNKTSPHLEVPKFLDIICIPKEVNNLQNPIIRSRIQINFDGKFITSFSVLHLYFHGEKVDRSSKDQFTDDGIDQVEDKKNSWSWKGVSQEDLRDKNVKDKREMTGIIFYDGSWHYSENMLRGKEIVFKMICDCTKIEDSEDTFKEKLTS